MRNDVTALHPAAGCHHHTTPWPVLLLLLPVLLVSQHDNQVRVQQNHPTINLAQSHNGQLYCWEN